MCQSDCTPYLLSTFIHTYKYILINVLNQPHILLCHTWLFSYITEVYLSVSQHKDICSDQVNISGQYLFHSSIFLSYCDVQTSSAAELWNHLDWTLFLNEGSERFNQSSGSVFKTQSTDLMFDSHVIRTNFLPTLNPLWSRSDYFTASSVCSPPSRAPLSGAFTFTTHSLTIF